MRFHQKILKWFHAHGRHDLPWQQNPTAYRVWVSEIMLQQTQVATVIPYFERFIQRFPTLQSLAQAHLDEVLAIWAGLGYYGRAKNLHRSAQIIVQAHQGIFPIDYDMVLQLPGIGPSTAGAILSLSTQQSYPILDGNVKRVLSRHFGIDGWPGDPAVSKKLWTFSAANTPKKEAHHYTQAIMDLGATLCTQSKPQCPRCPIQSSCIAHASNRIAEIPGKAPRKTIPCQSTQMLLLIHPQTHQVLLEKRPTQGIWGGLWSLPECALDLDGAQWAQQAFSCAVKAAHKLPLLKHRFTHFQLDIHPIILSTQATRLPKLAMPYQWHADAAIEHLGLPSPVKALVAQLRTHLLWSKAHASIAVL